MKKILKIKDLKKKDRKKIESFLKDHDFAEEMESWALEAARKRIFHRCVVDWNRPRLKKVLHPSSLSDPCDYRLFLDLWGADFVPKQSKTLQMIFDTGTAVHGQLDYLFATHAVKEDYTFVPEVGFKPTYIDAKSCGSGPVWFENDTIDELRCAGHADGLIIRKFNIGGKIVELRIVIEFKTISSSGFRKLTKPQISHTKQVHAYMTCIDAPIAVIMYINKDTSSLLAYPFLYDQEFWAEMYNRIIMINEIYHNYEEPSKRITNSCLSCGYYEECEPPISKRKYTGAPKI